MLSEILSIQCGSSGNPAGGAVGPLNEKSEFEARLFRSFRFLDVLAARKDPAGLSGEVLINGAPQPPNFKCLSGYVVQDDVVMGTLTVRENFAFSAALRLPTSISEEEKRQKVERLIHELGLGRVADSKVGTQLIRGVSGGERKRTNIGMELIIDPSVLFLDEPTTGLDASTANSVLLLMANHGRTIILSIHQPRYSIYRLFDSLTLLVNGKQVYHGPAQRALDYFSDIGYTCEAHNNPADFFLDVINGDSTAVAFNDDDGDDEGELNLPVVRTERRNTIFCFFGSPVEKIVMGKQLTSSVRSRTITYHTGFFTQFRWVLKRTFRNLLLNPQTSVAQVCLHSSASSSSGSWNLLTLLVAFLRFGALFFITVNQCFSSMSAAELFITERKLFVHEYISGYYRLSVYFLTKILSDILTMRTIPAIIFSCVAYFMIGFKAAVDSFFLFMFSVALVAYTATSMAMAISADQTVVAIATIFMTIICVFMMIFAGLLVSLPSIPSWLAWLKYLSIPRYGLSALSINEFTGLVFCPEDNRNNFTICTGEQYLTSQGIDYSTWGFWQNHMALLIMTACFLTITYLKLRFVRKFT
uniref:ATP-binding cassette, sub-family G (WHITE), member 2a n=1 Tax=Salarias fasciatus TaxID=181472 RepID=A0A672HHH2_SALFA